MVKIMKQVYCAAIFHTHLIREYISNNAVIKENNDNDDTVEMSELLSSDRNAISTDNYNSNRDKVFKLVLNYSR